MARRSAPSWPRQPADTSVGWTSLETNETYFSSDVLNGGVAINGDGTNYTMCTGEAGDCDQARPSPRTARPTLLAQRRHDGGHLRPHHARVPRRHDRWFPDRDGDKVDVSGYAIADITCAGHERTQGHPVTTARPPWSPPSATFRPTCSRPSLLDATPVRSPCFGVNQHAGRGISGLIIAGESNPRSSWTSEPTAAKPARPACRTWFRSSRSTPRP